MLYQTDYTMRVYRGRRLKDLVKSYLGSQYEKNVDENVARKQVERELIPILFHNALAYQHSRFGKLIV